MGLRKAIRETINKLGYDIQKIDPQFGTLTLANALERWKKFPFGFESLVDVGASDGRWSLHLEAVFPGKHHLLLDANKIHEPALKQVCSLRPGWAYRIGAVGQIEGTLFFDDSDPFGGHLSETQRGPNYRPCPVSTIDNLVREFDLPAPYFIKLDTHGVEIPILEGAKSSLKETEALVVEVYNIDTGPPQLPFWEFCRYLGTRGFRPLDLWEIHHRPIDNALWQFDLLFVRADLPLFKDYRYFKTPDIPNG
jgi:FkbM family methyltransferase